MLFYGKIFQTYSQKLNVFYLFALTDKDMSQDVKKCFFLFEKHSIAHGCTSSVQKNPPPPMPTPMAPEISEIKRPCDRTIKPQASQPNQDNICSIFLFAKV